MKVPQQTKLAVRRVISMVILVALGLFATPAAQAAGRNSNPGILPINSAPYGKSYAEWSALWWKLSIERPVAGNPFVEGGAFELSKSVWSLAAPLGSGTFNVTIPAGKALFLPAINVECSSLEPPDTGFHGDTAEEQAECAAFWVNHIINLSFTIDGVPVQNLAAYRVVSPQFSFTAPNPNVLGVAGGGPGTAVGDGYYIMLAPLSKGVHTLRLRGALHFSVAEGDPFDLDVVADNIFNVTVQ